jgi:cytochrome c-type biogenesis protein CcmF
MMQAAPALAIPALEIGQLIALATSFGVLMWLSVDTIVLVKPGETVHLAGYDRKLVELHDTAGPNHAARVATIQVSRDGRPVTVLAPERRSCPVQRMTTTEAKIETHAAADRAARDRAARDRGVLGAPA